MPKKTKLTRNPNFKLEIELPVALEATGIELVNAFCQHFINAGRSYTIGLPTVAANLSDTQRETIITGAFAEYINKIAHNLLIEQSGLDARVSKKAEMNSKKF